MADHYIPPPVERQRVKSYASEMLRNVLRKKAEREMEALRIYEPLPMQDAFHRCVAREVLAHGSNRSGKTTTTMVELARAVTGQDPYNKYPKTDGKAICVGKDQKHIAGVFYNKLFRRDAFKVIRDRTTKRWRAFHEYEHDDLAREAECKRSGPLIPPRLVKEIAWANKKAGVPEVVRMKNGWEIWFFTGEGEPPQGIAVDLAIFDEEIPNGRWYEEVAARLGDRHGRFIWSATPQESTVELYELEKRAYEERNDPDPSCVMFKMKMADNKHFPEAEKLLMAKKYMNNPDAYKVRILGESNVSSILVYPTFARAVHGVTLFNPDHPENGGIEIGPDWNLYAVVDPGRAVCAVGFFAVPPRGHELQHQRFLYDTLYLRTCNSEIFGNAMAEKCAGKRFHGFLIDPSSAKQDILGGGPSVYAQYGMAMAARKIECVNSGSNFMFACNDQRAGIMRFESWLCVRQDTNKPTFQYVTWNCPEFEWEIERYRRNKKDHSVSDKPIDRDDHLMDVCRYFAMYDPKWSPLPPIKPPMSPALAMFLKQLDGDKPKTARVVNLGPGPSFQNTPFQFN